MIMVRLFILWSIITCSFASYAQHITLESVDKHAQLWARTCATSLDKDNLEIVANTLYLLYAYALTEIGAQQSMLSCYRLAHDARTQSIINGVAAHKEFMQLQHYAQQSAQLLYMMGILGKVLTLCQEHCNQQEFVDAVNALAVVQQQGQNILCSWADEHANETGKMLESISTMLGQASQELVDAGQFFQELGKGNLPNMVEDSYKNLALIDTGLSAVLQSLLYTEQITEVFDNTADYMQTITEVGKDVYYRYYTALYTLLVEKSDSKTLPFIFGMNGIVPTEYQIYQLPHPDHVFEFTCNFIRSNNTSDNDK